MTTGPWFKCYPRDYNAGMVGLTLEERGAYVTILNLIYDRGGPIPEDVWWITSNLGCTTRAWVKVRAALIVKRKLFAIEIDGQPHLMNERAGAEIEKLLDLRRTLSASGKIGGQNAKAKASKNKDIGKAPLKPGLSQAQAYKTIDTDTEGSVVPTDVETTGAAGAVVDLDGEGWSRAVEVLTEQGGMTAGSARSFVGKLLSAYGIEGRDLIGPAGECRANSTRDPRAYLTKAAQARGRKRQTGPPKRVGYV